MSEVFNGTVWFTDSTYAAPTVPCPASSSHGASFYDAYTFCPAATPTTVRIQMDAISMFNPLLVIYDGAGIPPDPLTCVAGDLAKRNAEIQTLSIGQGQQITVVASGALLGHVGDYTLTVSTP